MDDYDKYMRVAYTFGSVCLLIFAIIVFIACVMEWY